MVQFQPDLLVVIANETFDTSGRVQPLLLACARMRAIECRRPLIRCVSGGFSAVINANGQLIFCSKRSAWTDPFVCPAIPLDRRTSPFTDWGRSGLWLLILLPVISVCRPVSGVE